VAALFPQPVAPSINNQKCERVEAKKVIAMRVWQRREGEGTRSLASS